MDRDYEAIAHAVRAAGGRATGDERLRLITDAIWNELHTRGVSWAGFYLPDPSDDQQLLLGPRRDKPACSPIGLHGACGWAFAKRRAFIVNDVRALGESYVACDPRDQSEIVIPVWDDHDTAGDPIGVLDLDSFDVDSFDESDLHGLAFVLEAGGLSVCDDAVATVRVT